MEMSGETEADISGWTTDTLHSHLTSKIDALDRRVSEQFDSSQVALAAALATQEKAVLAALAAAEKKGQVDISALIAQISALDRRVSEQFNTSQTALAAALAAQKEAVSAALAAADKAVDMRQTSAEREFHEHLAQQKHETNLIFQASDRAITKAEDATKDKFAAVNEFRGQLADQATRFLPRVEFDAQVKALRSEQIGAAERNAERIQELTNRLNRNEGKGVGLNAGWVYVLGFVAAIGTLISLYVVFKGGG